ncbi:phage holin [Loigolactobacillus binensis]|uniref:Phage holin n=1 Tax=Loigolactobacillus binensis TaxID=2559922 RepID=A0ABW3EC84_9LACO|nr:phage holin [Loigolactobacillus binensis]
MKINFDVKSIKAWTTLSSAVIAFIISLLAAFGVIVKQTDATALYSGITAVLSILAGMGILTDTNNPTGGDQVEK